MDTATYLALRFASLALAGVITFLILQIRENRKNKLTFRAIKKIIEKEVELGETSNDCFMKIADRLDKLEEDSEIHEEIIQTIISCVIDLGKVNGFLPYKDFDEEEIEESEDKNDKNNGKIMEEGLEILIRKANKKAEKDENTGKKRGRKPKNKESKSE